VTPRGLWLRLLAMWVAAATVLAFADPAGVGRAPPRTAAVVGALLAGGVLGALVARRRLRVSAAAVAVLAVAAAAEELVWRWFALGELARYLGVPAALAATSLAFGAVHRGARAQHVLTGASFGAVYVATGSVVGAWCAHVGYNAAVASRRAPPEPA
jgi:membrane protease YdiL (CAAX protease family)